RKRVVLPQPEGPTRTRNSPSWTSRETPFTALMPPGYVFSTRSILIAAILRTPSGNTATESQRRGADRLCGSVPPWPSSDPREFQARALVAARNLAPVARLLLAAQAVGDGVPALGRGGQRLGGVVLAAGQVGVELPLQRVHILARARELHLGEAVLQHALRGLEELARRRQLLEDGRVVVGLQVHVAAGLVVVERQPAPLRGEDGLEDLEGGVGLLRVAADAEDAAVE